MENIDAVVVGEVAEQHTQLCGLEMVERLFDQRVGQLGDHIGGHFRADRLEQEVAFFVIEVFVDRGEVGVVRLLGGRQHGGCVRGVERAHQLIERMVVDFLGHARRVGFHMRWGKEKERVD